MVVDPDVPLSKFPSLLVENEAHDAAVVEVGAGEAAADRGDRERSRPPPPVLLLPPLPVLPPPLPLPPLPPVLVAFGLTPAHPSPAATAERQGDDGQ